MTHAGVAAYSLAMARRTSRWAARQLGRSAAMTPPITPATTITTKATPGTLNDVRPVVARG